MKLSPVTMLYLPLGYWFLSQMRLEQVSAYYEPIPFRPLALYALLFVGFAALIFFDAIRDERRTFFWPRFAVIAGTILLFIGTALFAQVMLRSQTGNDLLIHDGAYMTEIAGEYLMNGENPYAVQYRDSAFGKIHAFDIYPGHDNPAWYYYIYLPFYTVASTALQFFGQTFFGGYDARFVLLPLFLVALWILYRAPTRRDDKLLGMFLFSFNPIFAYYFIAGYNDIFVFGWLFLSFYLLTKKRTAWSAVLFGLALTSKQSAWLAFPFYIAYVFYQEPMTHQWLQRIRTTVQRLWPMFLVVVVFLLPFFLWSPKDFWSDVIRYAGGSSEILFPVTGEGLSVILLDAGFINSVWDPYPFWIFQVVFGLPALVGLLWWLKRRNTVSNMIVAYALFLLLFWFLSRFFNPNYIGFISLLAIAAWALREPVTDTPQLKKGEHA